MVVAEKGVNATTDDMIGLANGLGKVLQGQVGALSKQGFVFDEATEAILKNGTEQEKVIALAGILDSTYEGLNETMRGTTEGGIKGATMAFGKMQEEIGKAFLPTVIKLTEAMTPVLNKITEWVQANPKLTTTIIAVSAGLFALVAVAGTIGLILPAIITGFGMLATAAGFLGTAFTIMLGPVGLIILAIAALVAAGVAIYKNWETISAFASTVWEGIKETIAGAMQRIAEIFSAVWEGIKVAFWGYVNFVIGLWATLLDFLVPGWDTALVAMWTRAVEIWEAIKGAFGEAFAVIKATFTGWSESLLEMWTGMWTAVKEVFVSIWEAIASVFDSIVEGIKSAMESLISPIQKVIDLAERALELAGGAIKSGAGKVSSLVKSIISRGSSITGKAIGGPVLAGTPYLVGENGPELFMPGQSGAIAPNGRFGGSTINLYITGNTLLDRDAARKIGDEMVRYLKANVRV
jgi:phage-related protein